MVLDISWFFLVVFGSYCGLIVVSSSRYGFLAGSGYVGFVFRACKAKYNVHNGKDKSCSQGS